MRFKWLTKYSAIRAHTEPKLSQTSVHNRGDAMKQSRWIRIVPVMSSNPEGNCFKNTTLLPLNWDAKRIKTVPGVMDFLNRAGLWWFLREGRGLGRSSVGYHLGVLGLISLVPLPKVLVFGFTSSFFFSTGFLFFTKYTPVFLAIADLENLEIPLARNLFLDGWGLRAMMDLSKGREDRSNHSRWAIQLSFGVTKNPWPVSKWKNLKNEQQLYTKCSLNF